MNKTVAYCKFGRSMQLNPAKYGFAGDAEAPQLLYRLAARNPDVTFTLIGQNSKEDEFPLPNIVNPWAHRKTGSGLGLASKLTVALSCVDGVVMHAGQMGTSHQSIPQSTSTWADYWRDPFEHATTPYDWAMTYGGFLVNGLNALGDKTDGRAPVAWLVPDPRNYLKARDVKWPAGHDDVLSQYQYTRTSRHERWRDPRTPAELGFDHFCETDRNGEIWVATNRYRYGGLELMILPDDWATWGQADFTERKPAGIATTSFKDQLTREPRRSELVNDWLLAAYPAAEVYGKWDDVSLRDVPRGTVTRNEPVEFPELLNRWRVTLALSVAGTSWVTAKVGQCWAARNVCFMPGRLDDQGWLLPSRRPTDEAHAVGEVGGVTYYSVRDDWTAADLQLAAWLRVETPEEFAARARVAGEDEVTWRALTDAQRNLLQRRWDEHLLEGEIERRLALK